MEPAFEIFAQVQKVEEVDITVEGNEYIDITLLSLLLPNIGAKQAEPLDSVMGFHLKLAVSDDFDYFLLSHNCSPVILYIPFSIPLLCGQYRKISIACQRDFGSREVEGSGRIYRGLPGLPGQSDQSIHLLTSIYEKTKTGSRLALALLINRR